MEQGESLTRQEVVALISANEKVATQLTVIAGQLTIIATNQDKMLSRLQNGLSADIATIKSTTEKIPIIHNNQIWSSWVINAIGLVVGAVGMKFLVDLLQVKP